MSDSNSSPAASKVKEIIAFKTPEKQKENAVVLFINRNAHPGSPDFDGKIGEKRVSAYIRTGGRGSFLSILGDKQADGRHEQLGTANIMCVKSGVAKLLVKLSNGAEPIWADIGDGAPEEVLIRAGLNLEMLARKRAEARGDVLSA